MARPPGAVLFACGLNRIRSPMAAGLLRRLHGAGVFVDSCGLRVDPEAAPDPFVAIVMDEIGIDMGDHAPKTFDDLIDESFDWIVSLSPEAHHRAVECAGGGAVKTSSVCDNLHEWTRIYGGNSTKSESRRSRTFVSSQTKGRCRSGRAITPRSISSISEAMAR